MSFKTALRSRDFVVAAELPLTPESTAGSLRADADVAGSLVDGLLLTDNQFGQPHISPSIAATILRHAGYSPILQLGCRSRNRIALLGELLGARAAGIDSLMLVRGNVVSEEFKPRPKAVMDVDVKELIATARTINDDDKLGADRDFLIGTSGTVHRPAPGSLPAGLIAKADAGAQLVITQLCLDAEILQSYLEFLVSTRLLQRLSIVVSIAVFPSAEAAIWLRDHRPQSIVPPQVIDRLAAADNAQEEGVAICAEFLRVVATIPGLSGVNFVSTGDLSCIERTLLASGVRA